MGRKADERRERGLERVGYVPLPDVASCFTALDSVILCCEVGAKTAMDMAYHTSTDACEPRERQGGCRTVEGKKVTCEDSESDVRCVQRLTAYKRQKKKGQWAIC